MAKKNKNKTKNSGRTAKANATHGGVTTEVTPKIVDLTKREGNPDAPGERKDDTVIKSDLNDKPVKKTAFTGMIIVISDAIDAVIKAKPSDIVAEMTKLLDFERELMVYVVSMIPQMTPNFEREITAGLARLMEKRNGLKMILEANGTFDQVRGRFNEQYIKHVPVTLDQLPDIFCQGAGIHSKGIFGKQAGNALTWISPLDTLNFKGFLSVWNLWRDLRDCPERKFDMDLKTMKYSWSMPGIDPSLSM